MDAKAAHEGIQSALKNELSKHWGEIAAIEAKVARSEGYLRKFCRGTRSISLNLLLKSLDALRVEPGVFFAKALGSPCNSDSFVQDLEQPGKEVPVLFKIEKTTLKIEAEPTAAETTERRERKGCAEDLLAKIIGCTGKEQKRRLRTAQRYRDPSFVVAYLGHLDRLLDENPKLVARLLETMTLELIPTLPCSKVRRLELQCRAIALFGDAHRGTGGFPTASRAVRFALEIARKHSLEKTIAILLKQAAFLLADHGQYEQALILLRERFEIFFDLGSRIDMGKTLTDRGIMLMNAGRFQASVRVLSRALELLPELTPKLRSYYLSTYSAIAYGYEQMKDFSTAEEWLNEAISTFQAEGGITQAKLIWQQGRMAYARKNYSAARHHLEHAIELLDERTSSESALVRLDLTRVLLTSGEVRAAVDIALQMAAFLSHFQKNKVAEAAIAEYTRLALEGRLTIAAIDQLQPKLKQRRT